MGSFVEGVVPSSAMHFLQAPYFEILSFFHNFKEFFKATALPWCPENENVTHKHLEEM
jgi:hypothetical protein